eukprot:CAMPEP_0119008106 /NCGR_PEP_ID=MMETSP1176-20130426/3471_1 /TAXON_ID=265551 /ORGANISM="Synedropsis recta cf, Strain CCMP1620" /LENGTH=68 /DNA_ID=CAMNT_0006960377 /DNA_START=126 /DNA_END=328 /DNA_ORIENTATION=-
MNNLFAITPPVIQPEILKNIGTSNPLTGLIRKKERNETFYARRSTFSHDLNVKNGSFCLTLSSLHAPA